MCKFMLNQTLAYLKDERTESKLFAEAHKVCFELPSAQICKIVRVLLHARRNHKQRSDRIKLD